MTDLDDRMGIPRDDDEEEQAVTGDLLPRERGTRGFAVQWHSVGGLVGCAQHVQRRRGNLQQHQRDFDPDRLHSCGCGNATTRGPMLGPGQNRNPVAGSKEHPQA